MAAWWHNTGGYTTGCFFAIFKFVALNMALSLGKLKEDEKWKFCHQ